MYPIFSRMLAKTHVSFLWTKGSKSFFPQTTNVVKHHKSKVSIGNLDTFSLKPLGDKENYQRDVKPITNKNINIWRSWHTVSLVSQFVQWDTSFLLKYHTIVNIYLVKTKQIKSSTKVYTWRTYTEYPCLFQSILSINCSYRHGSRQCRRNYHSYYI